MRLLQTEMRVVLDSGALASVQVSGEWQLDDALKTGDGQVTIALAESTDQKIDLTGKVRRRISIARVNVWATDMPNASESGKSVRIKIVEAVNYAIRRNRKKPNQTTYNFVGTGPNGERSKAFSGDIEASPSGSWIELSVGDYQNLWYSDDHRCQIISSESGKLAVMLLGFKVKSRSLAVTRMVFSFEGYGSSPSGEGVTVKVWNNVAGVWQNPQSNQAGGSDETLALTLTAGLHDLISSEGYVWFLAETKGASNGATLCHKILRLDLVSPLVLK